MSFLEDRKGQLLTLDLLLALVPLTIFIGMSASTLGGVVHQIQEYSFFYSMQRQTADAADVLVKTPGMPQDWNSSSLPSIVGLAKYSTTDNRTQSHVLDRNKLTALNLTNMSSVVGGLSYYLTVTNSSGYYEDASNTRPLVKAINYSHGTSPPGNATIIVIVERAALPEGIVEGDDTAVVIYSQGLVTGGNKKYEEKPFSLNFALPGNASFEGLQVNMSVSFNDTGSVDKFELEKNGQINGASTPGCFEINYDGTPADLASCNIDAGTYLLAGNNSMSFGELELKTFSSNTALVVTLTFNFDSPIRMIAPVKGKVKLYVYR